MSEERKKVYTRDPVRNEDVLIECCPQDRRTDSQHIEGDELPVLIESDFRHDPVEGCQGSYTKIEEIPYDGGCPVCGYDRMKRHTHTLADVTTLVCIACESDITHEDEPKRPFGERHNHGDC